MRPGPTPDPCGRFGDSPRSLAAKWKRAWKHPWNRPSPRGVVASGTALGERTDEGVESQREIASSRESGGSRIANLIRTAFGAVDRPKMVDFGTQDWYTRPHRACNKYLILLNLCRWRGNQYLSFSRNGSGWATNGIQLGLRSCLISWTWTSRAPILSRIATARFSASGSGTLTHRTRPPVNRRSNFHLR